MPVVPYNVVTFLFSKGMQYNHAPRIQYTPLIVYYCHAL